MKLLLSDTFWAALALAFMAWVMFGNHGIKEGVLEPPPEVSTKSDLPVVPFEKNDDIEIQSPPPEPVFSSPE